MGTYPSHTQQGGNAGYEDERQKRREIRKWGRYVQILMDELRGQPEDKVYERTWLMKEIESVLAHLEGLGVPRESFALEEEVFEDAKEYQRPLGRRIRFGKPKVAFYEPEDTVMSPTPMQRHPSLEEIARHDEEMQQAYDEALQQPRWIRGGGIPSYLPSLKSYW